MTLTNLLIIIIVFVIALIFMHDCWIIKKYKRGKITKDQIKRSQENKNRIYVIIDTKKVFHHVRGQNTLKRLGFDPNEISKESNGCFSKEDYEQRGYVMGSEIRIYLNLKETIDTLIKLIQSK
ncbi:MAG: hypothetical protein ABH896_01895 [Candidatus Jacksonbacteria bacterium]